MPCRFYGSLYRIGVRRGLWYYSFRQDVRQDTLAFSLEMQEAYPYAKLTLLGVQYGIGHTALDFDDGLFLSHVEWGYCQQHDDLRHHENIVIDEDACSPHRQVMGPSMINIILVAILMHNGDPPMDRMSVMLSMLSGSHRALPLINAFLYTRIFLAHKPTLIILGFTHITTTHEHSYQTCKTKVHEARVTHIARAHHDDERKLLYCALLSHPH